MQNILAEMLKINDKASLVSALGAAIDAWCMEKGEKSIEVANLLNNKVVEVNTAFGEMKRENSTRS